MRFIHIASTICACSIFLAYNPHESVAKPDNHPATQSIQSGQNSEIPMIPASFADLAERLIPSVVNISSTQKRIITQQDFFEIPQFPEESPFEDFFNEFMQHYENGISSIPTASLGSGFIIDAQKGYIVTNYHVVRNAEDIRVTFNNDITVDAKLIGADEKTDIAVLQIKVDAKDMNLTAVSFGNSDIMRIGDWTMAIGTPFGLGGSVTAGIISARARDIHSGPYDDYIQTDASINRGNSGGPLFNLKGEVIGINTAIYSPTGGSVGIGFAIPSSLAKPVIDQIIKYGHTRRGWLGVRIQRVTDEIAEALGLEKASGALVASVNDKGSAKKSGIKAGDVILKVNGQIIKEMRSLPRIIAEYDVGTKVEVTYWRNHKKHKTFAIIGELEKAENEGLLTAQPETNEYSANIELRGLTVKTLTDSLRSKYHIPEHTNGILISNISPSSEAARKGIKIGDIIEEINQQPISENEEAADIISKAKENGNKSVLLLINSKGNTRFVALHI